MNIPDVSICVHLFFIIVYTIPYIIYCRGLEVKMLRYATHFFSQAKTSIEVLVISRDRPLSQEVAGTWPYISWKMQGAWDQMALPRMDLSTCFYAMFKG